MDNDGNRKPISVGKGNILAGDHILFGKVASDYAGGISYLVLDSEKDNAGEKGAVFVISEELWGTDAENGGLVHKTDFDNFDDPTWNGSTGKIWCENFQMDNLSDIEYSNIRPVSKEEVAEHLYDFEWLPDIGKLDNEKVFFLSIREYQDFLLKIDGENDSKQFSDKECFWWLRSACGDDFTYYFGYIGNTGNLVNKFDVIESVYPDGNPYGLSESKTDEFSDMIMYYGGFPGAARPAFNISMDSVLFVSDRNFVKNTSSYLDNVDVNQTTGSWRLTLLDDENLYVFPGTSRQSDDNPQKIILDDLKYSMNGDRISVIMTDKELPDNISEYSSEFIRLLCYGKVNLQDQSFVLPEEYTVSGWGNEYHIYLLDEKIHNFSGVASDFSCTPVEIYAPGILQITTDDHIIENKKDITSGDSWKYTAEFQLGISKIDRGERICFGKIADENDPMSNNEIQTSYIVLTNNETIRTYPYHALFEYGGGDIAEEDYDENLIVETNTLFVVSEYLHKFGKKSFDTVYNSEEFDKYGDAEWKGYPCAWCFNYILDNFPVKVLDNGTLSKFREFEHDFKVCNRNTKEKVGYSALPFLRNFAYVYFLSAEEVFRYFKNSFSRQAVYVDENGKSVFRNWWLRNNRMSKEYWNTDDYWYVNDKGYLFEKEKNYTGSYEVERFLFCSDESIDTYNDNRNEFLKNKIDEPTKRVDIHITDMEPCVGKISEYQIREYARPAFRIELNKILFSSFADYKKPKSVIPESVVMRKKEEGAIRDYGDGKRKPITTGFGRYCYHSDNPVTIWRLTLLDTDGSGALLSVTPGEAVFDKTNTGKVMFPDLECSGIGERISVMITDKEWEADDKCTNIHGASILRYGMLDTEDKYFIFPEDMSLEGWGNDYFVYLLEELLHDSTGYSSDFASNPVQINLPKQID